LAEPLSLVSLDYTFHVEHLHHGEWTVPSALPRRSKYSHIGEFLWLPHRHPVSWVFFATEALIPFNVGIPPAWHTSPLYTWFEQFYDFDLDEWQISWIPFEHLLLDDWPTQEVLVASHVEARFGYLFGDGEQPFPEAELKRAGCKEWTAQFLRGRSTPAEHGPLNRTYGKLRRQLELAEPDSIVSVSWVDTLVAVIGDDVVSAFRDLQRYGAGCDLRIIATLS
jgi:hypothetical protein